MVKVGVIIPLYNKAQHIARALDSVLSQTYKDYEVIVVDDGSTDDGLEIVKRYTDPRLRVVSQENTGPGAARNKGVAESTSQFLSFLDADDEWMPIFLETCVKVLEDNPDCDVAASAYFLGVQGKDVTDIFRDYGMAEGPWRLKADISDYQLQHAIYILHSSSALFKRGVVEKYGGFYTKNHCRNGEDFYLWIQVMFNHKIYRILKPLYWYHLEASELGLESPAEHQLHPFLTDIEPIRENCPDDLKELLERFLSQFALSISHECVAGGSFYKVRYLMKHFPLMKEFRWEYAKLRLKLAWPGLIPVVRYMKKVV
ncbi:glycosyltransferase family 2 protein [Planctomycetota bacterium]